VGERAQQPLGNASPVFGGCIRALFGLSFRGHRFVIPFIKVMVETLQRDKIAKIAKREISVF
jgi:hypothetical protein